MKKRKFFSFMLMGLLTLGATSMVTSCKDYDDDINNLQDEQASLTQQINTLQSTLSSVQSAAASHATKTELEAVQSQVTSQGTQLNSLASQVTTAISNAQSASDAATAAQTAVSNLKAQVDAIDLSGFLTSADLANYVTATTLKEQLDAFKTEIQNANKEQLDEIKANVAKYDSAINTLYTAVTSVDIVGRIQTPCTIDGSTVGTGLFQQNETSLSAEGAVLHFVQGYMNTGDMTDGKLVFGEKKAAPSSASEEQKKALYSSYEGSPKYTYSKDDFVKSSESLIIRVNPANANIDASMIKIINSKGESITSVQVDSVVRYNELITRAGESGLWRLYVSPTEANNADAYPAGTRTDDNNHSISYFVAVNNTNSVATKDNNAADRYIVSREDVLFGKVAQYDDTKNAGDITVKAASEALAHKISDLRGRGLGAYYDAKSTTASTTNTVYAQNGDEITVSFENVPTVDRFYVVRDNNLASDGQSQTSDINAWNGYTYTGCVGGVTGHEVADIIEVNNGTGKGKFTVTINGQTGDEVAFRIYAVDKNGKLVRRTGYDNAYGFPFVIYVGSEKSTATVTGTVTADDAESARTITLPLTGTLKNGTQMIPVNTALNFKDSKGGTITFYAHWYDKDNKEVTTADKLSTVTYVKLLRNSDSKWSDWNDDTNLTYTITTTGTGEDKTVENIINFDLTKVLPDEAYTAKNYGYEWRTGQVKDPYVAFLIPTAETSVTNAWTQASVTNGYTDLNQPLMNLKDNTYITVTNSKKKNNAFTDVVTAGPSTPWRITVDKDILGDNDISDTKTATTTHHYAYVSSASKQTDKGIDVSLESFSLQYACPLNTNYTTVANATPSYTITSGNNKGTYTFTLVYGQSKIYVNNGTTTSEAPTAQALLANADVVFNNQAARSALGYSGIDVNLAKLLTEKYASDNVSVQILADGKTTPDYFNASIDASGVLSVTAIPEAQAPTSGNVTENIVIKAKDVFGHTNTYTIPIVIRQSISTAKQK